MTTIRSLALLFIAVSMAAACSVPSLHGIAGEGTTVFDESLLGDWLDPDGARFEVARGDEGRYAITIHSEGEEPLELTAALVLVKEDRILDVSLGKAATQLLDERYGALLVTTHQLYRLATGENTVLLETLDRDWLEGFSAYDAEVGDMGLLVSDPGHLFWLLEKALADQDAWTESMEFSRPTG